jgi:hypothetical protein
MMDCSQFIQYIRNPESIKEDNASSLTKLCHDYPYCSSLFKLNLKALKKANSEHYNQTLKLTAALSPNRAMLFEYIIHDKANNYTNNLTKKEADDPELLDIGRPLEFDKNEYHSFTEWLKMTQPKPIRRSNPSNEKLKIENLNPIEKTDKIVNFINLNSAKQRPKKEFFSPNQMAQESIEENNNLMTETLARVYLEQGHYDKAIAAYEIISLKYPQKSGLFADQIKAIKKLKS